MNCASCFAFVHAAALRVALDSMFACLSFQQSRNLANVYWAEMIDHVQSTVFHCRMYFIDFLCAIFVLVVLDQRFVSQTDLAAVTFLFILLYHHLINTTPS